MSMTVTGREFKAFYADPKTFPGNAYHDDVELYVNDELFMGLIDQTPDPKWADKDIEVIPDTAKVTVKGGVIIHGEIIQDFVKALRAWCKTQTNQQVLVSVPKDKVKELKAAIKALGGTVDL